MYEVKIINEVVDAEVNTAAELFISTPVAGTPEHTHPYGVRIVDRDVNESVSVRRFRNLDDATACFAEIS